MDKRYTIIKKRLESLTNKEIQRIIDNQHILCTDTLNYDQSNNTFCPLALALNLHTISNPTNEVITELLGKRFIPVNVIKSIEGEFYTKNRKTDIITLCHTILKERKYLQEQRAEYGVYQ